MQTFLSAIFLTPQNLMFYKRLYQGVIHVDPFWTDETNAFREGMVVIVMIITLPDIFKPDVAVISHEERWLLTREQFEERFDIVPHEENDDSFAHVALKSAEWNI